MEIQQVVSHGALETLWKQVGFRTPHYMRGELIYSEIRDFQRENLVNIF